ncbi:hypothetical protein PIB30_037306 [Stylosanthes scabra]|uniref:X8 domain-containing protein n=1 Tax=Stylosanthes scabra TaxID=79078 RepID=A0ABU6YCB8_9FABA|nr:hypothetical protein [Stylosanthes scabra]
MAAPKIFDMLLLTIVTYTIVVTMNMPTTEAEWCVARFDASEKDLQQGLDYACLIGADCDAIQDGGPCFYPDNLRDHANYAYDTYWKKDNRDPSSCDFGGTAEIVTRDPRVAGDRRGNTSYIVENKFE